VKSKPSSDGNNRDFSARQLNFTGLRRLGLVVDYINPYIWRQYCSDFDMVTRDKGMHVAAHVVEVRAFATYGGLAEGRGYRRCPCETKLEAIFTSIVVLKEE
jgi:hypothetical protein